MAATIGFGEILHLGQHFMQAGGFGGLPNSVMSAPAMKVRPPQVSTIAFTSGSAIGALDAFEDAAPHRGAERVHRRTVDRDDGDDVHDVRALPLRSRLLSLVLICDCLMTFRYALRI